MKKEDLEKWNNTCIKIESYEHGSKVIDFWKSVGVETDLNGHIIGGYYGIFKGKFTFYTNESYRGKVKRITIEEAIGIRDKNNKTFPREMYCWDYHIESADKCMVYFIIEKSREVDQPVLVVSNGVSYVYTNAMEVEEYESMMKNKNDNNELIKLIEKTEKELAELKSKLK